MKCPIEGTELVMSERQGIEIDYCPQCRGVWLDRGELDKIIERLNATTIPSAQSQAQPMPEYSKEEYRRPDSNSNHQYSKDRGNHKKKKESFLGDIFDF